MLRTKKINQISIAIATKALMLRHTENPVLHMLPDEDLLLTQKHITQKSGDNVKTK